MTNLVLEYNQAICLIEAVDDLRFELIKYYIEERGFSPNSKNHRGFSVVHYCCGIDKILFAERTLFYLFEHGANVNEPTKTERFTPLHIAAMNDRVSIAKILIKQGADKKFLDADGNPPIYYAISNENMTMIEVIRNYILHEKNKIKKQSSRELLESAHMNNVFETNLTVGGANAAFLDADCSTTPSRIIYNFDKASPYYVNITHRRKMSRNGSSMMRQSSNEEEKSQDVNIFELTEANLARFSKNIRESGRFDMFKKWKSKIEEHKKRQSALSSVLDECQTFLGRDEQHVEALMTEDETFITARSAEPNILELPVRESDFIRSPTRDNEVVLQMTERYIHTDDEKNIVFYEKKLLPVEEITENEEIDKASTMTASTAFKLNTDYDTDQLRRELTQFGDVPGPITKSTKKLYLKRLVKYKRDPKMAEQAIEKKNSSIPVYSLELEKTFNVIDQGYEVFVEFLAHEEEMVRYFLQKNSSKKMREGNKKMSFIYLLMDPRDLNNLAANHTFLSKEQAWRQFIKSIFYVGKGKKSRPYAHLYEAIRHFSQSIDKENLQVFNRHPQPLSRPKPPLLQFCETSDVESKKLKRILDIWATDNGVVSMHIFNNITPSEAYTREAAIIDAIGMNNLTNQVRGHYYGITESWNFRQRKQLGVGLLYKALQIHLIEGESQLFPNDI